MYGQRVKELDINRPKATSLNCRSGGCEFESRRPRLDFRQIAKLCHRYLSQKKPRPSYAGAANHPVRSQCFLVHWRVRNVQSSAQAAGPARGAGLIGAYSTSRSTASMTVWGRQRTCQSTVGTSPKSRHAGDVGSTSSSCRHYITCCSVTDSISPCLSFVDGIWKGEPAEMSYRVHRHIHSVRRNRAPSGRWPYASAIRFTKLNKKTTACTSTITSRNSGAGPLNWHDGDGRLRVAATAIRAG
jgi:hypothetical protein